MKVMHRDGLSQFVMRICPREVMWTTTILGVRGRIQVESEVGEGTTVRILLPIRVRR